MESSLPNLWRVEADLGAFGFLDFFGWAFSFILFSSPAVSAEGVRVHILSFWFSFLLFLFLFFELRAVVAEESEEGFSGFTTRSIFLCNKWQVMVKIPDGNRLLEDQLWSLVK